MTSIQGSSPSVSPAAPKQPPVVTVETTELPVEKPKRPMKLFGTQLWGGVCHFCRGEMVWNFAEKKAPHRKPAPMPVDEVPEVAIKRSELAREESARRQHEDRVLAEEKRERRDRSTSISSARGRRLVHFASRQKTSPKAKGSRLKHVTNNVREPTMQQRVREGAQQGHTVHHVAKVALSRNNSAADLSTATTGAAAAAVDTAPKTEEKENGVRKVRSAGHLNTPAAAPRSSSSSSPQGAEEGLRRATKSATDVAALAPSMELRCLGMKALRRGDSGVAEDALAGVRKGRRGGSKEMGREGVEEEGIELRTLGVTGP